MHWKGLAITAGLGAAAGAVAVLMLPRQCAVRQLANKAAYAAEDAMHQVTGKFMDNMG